MQIGHLYQKIDSVIDESDTLGGVQIESKKALAMAYANLLLEDPRMVTIGHLRILERELSPQQVCTLTKFLLSHSGKHSDIFIKTFEEVFGACQPSDSAA